MPRVELDSNLWEDPPYKTNLVYPLIDNHPCTILFTLRDDLQDLDITDIFEKLVKEDGKKVADLDNVRDLFYWGEAFWFSRNVCTEEDAYSRMLDVLDSMGDPTKRSKKQNRELFNVIANDQIKRMNRKPSYRCMLRPGQQN